MTNAKLPSHAEAVLAWYDRYRRALPWRAPPGARADPYRVWLSEIMLQQTTVQAVKPYYAAFLARWPDIEALAAASLDEVLKAWAGLGYYARARNLKACAERVVADHGGRFPTDEDALRTLPGIGAYTAAAFAAIAFDRPAVVVDGNVERVVARLFALQRPLPGAKGEIRSLTATIAPAVRPGDFAQAMMDLGAGVCTPKRPACSSCPLAEHCAGHAAGLAGILPLKTPKKPRPVRRATLFWLERADGSVLLRRRPPKGLLGGMLEVPGTPWLEEDRDETPADVTAFAPARTQWRRLPGAVRHTFTHFQLELEVWTGAAKNGAALAAAVEPERCLWVARSQLHREALPSVMRKVAAHAATAGEAPGPG